ncbi:MAG: signal peptidase I, partial [Planctomycetota bacterium]
LPARAPRRERSGILEAFALVLVALVLALTLKTYVAEAYEIKGRSMEPTFHNGERVVVLKAFYEIHRHDIVVFASSEDPSKDLVKRVVGLPGETVRVVGGRVFVNGEELKETYIRDFRPGFGDVVYEAKVPPGHYYVLGDNRPDSHDSRYFHAVPAARIRGKVVLRLWPPRALRGF